MKRPKTEDQRPKTEDQRPAAGRPNLPRKLVILNVVDILPNPRNPRTVNKKDPEFLDFAANIGAQGVVDPVRVRTHPTEKGKYETLDGHRREAACEYNFILEIPALDYGDISDRQASEIFYAAQRRKDLTVFEESKLVDMLMTDYAGDVNVVASRIGKGVRWVRQMAAINGNLAHCWRKSFEKGQLLSWSATELRLLAGYPQSTQKQVFECLQYSGDMSLADLQRYLAEQMRRLDKAMFDCADPTLTNAGACLSCSKQSAHSPGLFDETTDEETVKKNSRCLDLQCWRRKEAAALANKVTVLKKEHPQLVVMAREYLLEEEFEAAKKYGLPIVCVSEFDSSKKGVEGAVPAVVIKGRGLGELVWIKPAAGRKQVLDEDGRVRTKTAGTPKTLKERKKLLESKRWFVTIKALIGKIGECEAGDLIEDMLTIDRACTVMALAETFGVTGMEYGHQYPAGGRLKDNRTWEYFASRTDIDEVLAGLWEQCRDTICRDLAYNGPLTQVPEELIEDAKSAAKLLGIDIEALFIEVGEKQYPEPKGWKDLNADGTPKVRNPGRVTRDPEHEARATDKIRKCRICGCTEDNPCIDENGDTCSWVDGKKDLCSNPECVKKASEDIAGAKKEARKKGRHFKRAAVEEPTSEQLQETDNDSED